MKNRCRKWYAPLLLIALLLPKLACAEDATLDLGPGVFYLRFLTLPEQTELDTLLADQLPGGVQWQRSTRILTADQPEVLGAFYDSNENRWRGTLKEMKVGRGYWIVLPDNSPAVHLVIQDARIEGGIAPWSSPQGVLITTENGSTVIRPASPPRSRATYEVKKSTSTRTITASSGVYIQQPPQPGQAPSSVGGAQPVGTSPGGAATWVKVQLDTLYGQGASSAYVPVAGQGTVTVPPPTDFDIAPWGRGAPPE